MEMSLKSDLRILVKSSEDLAYALRDTLDVLADHERRIKLIEEKLGFLAEVESQAVEKAAVGGRSE
jgi:hypothetical protein